MKIHFRDCIPYDEYEKPLDPECDASYKDYIRPICDFFDNVCGINVAPSTVDFLGIKKYIKFVCYNSDTKDINNYTLTVENGKVVDVYVNPHKCYVIKLENVRYGDEEILYDEGIFESKEDAVGRIEEMAQILSKERNMIIRNTSDSDNVEDFEILVTYESCKQCPMHEEDYPCIGECYADHYRFGLVEYVLHKKE